VWWSLSVDFSEGGVSEWFLVEHCNYIAMSGYCHEICLSVVCLSVVCNASVLWQNGWRYDQAIFTEVQLYALALCKPRLMTEFEWGPSIWGLKVECGGFRFSDAVSRKRCEIEPRWQLVSNSKSYMSFRLQRKLMTLNDFEHQFSALLSELCVLIVTKWLRLAVFAVN